MMPTFLHPWLLAGLGLVSVPILIHLLHRMRYRTVHWAPMEFLLGSHRRNRRRLWLEQFLLLLLRCAAVALLVLIVARPQVSDAWGMLLGSGTRTEHVVILDDSYSMGQVAEDGTAFDSAGRALDRLLTDLERRPGTHVVTILPSTQPHQPELESTRLDSAVLSRLRQIINGKTPSSRATSPADALATAAQRLESAGAGPRFVHLLSDFQAKDWPDRGTIPEILRRLTSVGVQIQLIDVTSRPPPNSGVVDLSPQHGTPAAGLPITIDAAVRNFSSTGVTHVSVIPKVDGRLLPSRTIDRIASGGNAATSVEVQLASSGPHEVRVDIGSDGLAADNSRWFAVDVAEKIPVLLVDGSSDGRDSMFLSLALAPGEGVGAPIEPDIRSLDQFRANELARYRAVYLLNVPELDSEQVKALASYVEAGGGLAIFMGDQVRPERYNRELGTEGVSLLPVPLTSRESISESTNDDQGDLRPETHPIFRIFTGQRNSFLDTIAITDRFGVDIDQLSKNARVIARHRDGAPLLIESSLGKGRVVLSLTTAGDDWNSWPQNPTYVVTMLMLQDHLTTPAARMNSFLVGEPWKLTYSLADYRREFIFERPSGDAGVRVAQSLSADLNGSEARIELRDVEDPGVYRITRTRADGSLETISRAYNLTPEEGDLAKISPDRLANELSGVPHTYSPADQSADDPTTFRLEAKDGILALLVLVLLAEQLLARRLSSPSSSPSNSPKNVSIRGHMR